MLSGDCNKAFQSVHVISQDSYFDTPYFARPFNLYSERKDNSFENGHGIDWDRTVQNVKDVVIAMNSKEMEEDIRPMAHKEPLCSSS